MAKITKIEVQKRPGRYNVYLDGKYAFPVAESVLIQFNLMKGLELTSDQVKQIESADQQAKAYAKMLDYLSYQPRTTADVIKKLKENETPVEFIEPIIAKLQANKFLDDRAYAEAYVRMEMMTGGKGPGIIRQKLRLKKVSDEEIEAALMQFTPELQTENAAKLAEKLFRRYQSQPGRRREQKVRQGLITKGYSSEIYDQIKEQVEPVPDQDQEAELLATTAEKQWRHYRRYQGYQRIQRFKQSMYRKGFDLDAVQRWLDEHAE